MPTNDLDDKTVFNAAREIDCVDARREHLQQACGGDVGQLERVTALLRGYEKDSGFLESPALDLLQTAISPTRERPGAQIGPYKIREQLGEGGMGAVYAAEQTQPVQRKVALKIIKPGLDSRDVLARFDAERQALAMMSHPNIAKILDGGTTDTGRPYFVMELVKGVAITKFCDQQQLDMRQRLELFVTVCEAVQHAHLKGIIHRDLKPSNILVELHDVAAMPKVIDFGVAKAINQQLTQQTIYTQFSQVLGTPLYMSPEQAQLSGLDVDTRSDVYSLGVLLYELLVGVTPFDEKVLSSVGLDEWRRIIREDEPQRPSYKVSTLNRELISTISDRRKTKPRELSLSMRRELDWIVMRALEKDRNRRYQSSSALASDIQRYLDGEPVEAFPPSATYRLRKFAGRNKAAFVTTGLVAAALIIGTSVSIWQAREANDARQLADQRFVEADEQRQIAVRAAKQAQRNEDFSRQLVYAADVRLAAQAWESGDVRRFSDLLDRHTPITGKADQRGFEWWYLRQFSVASFHDIATQTGGSCVVRFSPGGKYLVTGQHDGTVCFWDGQSYERLATLRGHEGLVRGIDFSPDGNRMASIGDDGMIRIWDPAEQKQIRSFQAHPDHGFRVFYVAEGQTLASCGEDTSVRLWNASTGESLGELKGYARTVERAAMDRSPDGRLCVSGNPVGLAYVWDTTTRKRLCELELGVCDSIRCKACGVRFSPDGKLVAVATNQNVIRLCDVRTGKLVATFTGHDDDIQGVAFHPSGSLLASSDIAGVIRVWPLDSAAGEVENDFGSPEKWPPYFRGHSARAWSLDFSPDGSRLVSASKDGHVRSWSGREPTRQHVSETGDQCSAMTFVAQGRELLIAGDNHIHTWNRQTGEIRRLGESFQGSAACVAISPDDETCVSGHRDGMIRFWDTQTGQLHRTMKGHKTFVEKMVFSPDGLMLATGGWDGTAKLWDAAAAGKPLAVFEMPPHCYDVAFSPDGRQLACSSESDAMIFDVASGKLVHLLRGHQNSAKCLAFSPCGRLLATGSHDRTIRIWNVDTGEAKHVIAAHRNEINSLAFSPDGRTIASGGRKGTIAFSHVETGRFLFDTKIGDRNVGPLQFSPDGKSLAATVDEQGILLLLAPQ